MNRWLILVLDMDGFQMYETCDTLEEAEKAYVIAVFKFGYESTLLVEILLGALD